MDTVQRNSSAWVNSLAHIYETDDWATVLASHFPIFPWITPRIPKIIKDLVLEQGNIHNLKAGDFIIAPGTPVNKFGIVIKGFTARSLVSPLGVEGNGIGIAPPQHIACGNLNFFSGRPCFGNYYALTKTTIAECPTDKLKELVKHDPRLLLLLCRQLEGCSLSDRYSFGCQGILASEDKLKALICGWAANFGHNILNDSTKKIEIPNLPPYKLLGKICSINWLIVKGLFNKWKDEGLWESGEQTSVLSPSLVSNIYSWITREGKEYYPEGYPKSLGDLLDLKQKPWRPTIPVNDNQMNSVEI